MDNEKNTVSKKNPKIWQNLYQFPLVETTMKLAPKFRTKNYIIYKK